MVIIKFASSLLFKKNISNNLAKLNLINKENSVWIKFLSSSFYSNSSSTHQFKLFEVGVFTPVQTVNYETGQLFLHKLFGYRGVILFPWTANVFDKNDESSSAKTTTTPTTTTTTTPTTPSSNETPITPESTTKSHDRMSAEELERNGPPERAKAKKLTYYQVLIDTRDLPYIRSLPESVTFLSGPHSNRSVHTIHGLDFVSQHDVLPYTSTEKMPIIHELFERFLRPDTSSRTKFSARDELRAWQEGYHQWLELSDVCICTTQNIRITVIPFYLGVKEDQRKKLYWWRYSIRIENLSNQPVTLKERHWRIFSQAGTFETVKAKGVVGQEPYLTPEQPVFQYSSHVNLQSPSGHMWGTFKMEREDGSSFEARIPSFYLECKDDDK